MPPRAPVLRGPPSALLSALLCLLLLVAAAPATAESPPTARAEGWTAPAVAGGVVYVGRWRDDGDGDLLLALDAASGEERWRFRFGHRLAATPALLDGTLFVGDDRFSSVRGAIEVAGTLYAIGPATGAERWRFATERGIRSAPTVADGTVYLAAGFHNPGIRPGGSLSALDAATGDERWRGDVGLRPPLAGDGALFADPSPNDIVALDAATGQLRWAIAPPPST